MREKEYHVGFLAPLGTSGRYELIEYDLTCIGKVSELCFPKDKCLRRLYTIPVFKAYHASF